MQLSRPLPGKGGVIVHNKTDMTGTVLDPEARNGSTIVLPIAVLSWEQRVNLFGDTDPRRIDPTQHAGECKEVMVPFLQPYHITTEHLILDHITYRADNLLRIIDTCTDPIIIQRSVSKYHDEIASRLSGKDGLLSRHVWSIRIRNSARFVMASGADIPDNYVGIPRKIAQKIGVREGGLVILNRAPTLWQDSVLVMKARIIPGMAGRANPKCMRGLGLDFDGDSVAIFKWPDGVEPPREFGAECTDLPTPLANRWDRFTLGPKDLFGESEFLQEYSKVKALPTDLDKYVRGMTIAEFVEETNEVTQDLTRMKLQLGMISGTMDKIISLVSPSVLPIALHAKERLVQALLDSKHGTDYIDGKVIAATFEGGLPDDMQAVFIQAGLSTEKAQILVDELLGLGIPPLTSLFRELHPDMSVVKGSKHREDLLLTAQKYVEASCTGTYV